MKRLELLDLIDLDQAQFELEEAGLIVAYSEEEINNRFLHIFDSANFKQEDFAWIKTVKDYELPEVDWVSQWEDHCPYFEKGLAQIPLLAEDCKATIILKPGPGFGDFSHPTTRLMLELIKNLAKNRIVVDIGSGSGILTFAAAKMGADFCYGIEIDPEALLHSEENRKLNQLTEKSAFFLPNNFTYQHSSPPLILMNMIFSEQREAWSSLPSLHSLESSLITSGIQKQEKEAYLNYTKELGFHLLQEIEEENWLAFHLQTTNEDL